MTDKACIIVFIVVILICCTLGAVLCYFNLGEEDISDEQIELEKTKLYKLEETTVKDVETLMGNDDISIDISSKDKIILTFKEEHSVLRVTYSTNYEIIEEQFINTYSTIGNNILAVTLGIILGFMASGPVTCSIVATYASYLEKKDIRRLRAKPKKQKKKRNEVTVTQV